MAKLYSDETGKWYGGDTGLSKSEYQINGLAVQNFCTNLSQYSPWSANAICALLGNMTAESSVNPMRNEVGGSGYGLVQWTPKSNLQNRAKAIGRGSTYNSMYTELLVIDYEARKGIQWYSTSRYPITFKEFMKSDADLEWLTGAFLCNYERPADQSDSAINRRYNRTDGAMGTKQWYEWLYGETPPEPPEPPEPSPDPPEPSPVTGWNYKAKPMIFLPPKRGLLL